MNTFLAKPPGLHWLVLGLVSNYALAESQQQTSIFIEANGAVVSWQISQPPEQTADLLVIYEHTDASLSSGVKWTGVAPEQENITLWPGDGAGTYTIKACYWDALTASTTVCSNQVQSTWVYDVNGNFTAIPTADPAMESGSILLSANGANLTWQVTGNPGQASGYMLLWNDKRIWQNQETRSAEWYPTGGYDVGIHELRVCSYDHYRDQINVCSNSVSIEVAQNGHQHIKPVPSPDPALENGSLVASLTDDCSVNWQVEGNVGSSTGFMLLAENGAQPVYGVSGHKYAEAGSLSANLDFVWDTGTYHAEVCGYDYHRNQVHNCSAAIEFDISWGSNGKVCSSAIAQVPPPIPPVDEPPVDQPPTAPVVPEPPAVPVGNQDDIMTAGMLAWRTPDHNGNSCASCHAPDGIDLAFPNFSRDDILRRANDHLAPDLSEDIANLIEAVREQYNWHPIVDPREYRPFQPGGEVLPGETEHERDNAFSQQLANMGLILATGEVNDMQTALQARDELLAINLWDLAIGIPFDRFSEDPAFGTEHHSFKEWLPAVGHVPASDNPGEWYAIQDTYLENPTDENLYALLNSVRGTDRPVELNQEDQRGGLAPFEAERLRSLWLLSHEQRRLMSGGQPLGTEDHAPYNTNSIYSVGVIARETWECDPIHHGNPDDCMQLPMDENQPETFFQQMVDMSTTWRTMGWLLNNGLTDVAGERSTLHGHYLSLHYRDQGYYSHNAFFRAMLAVRKFYGNDNRWRYQQHYTGGAIAQTNAQPHLLFMDFFMSQNPFGGLDMYFVPTDPEHEARYVRFVANMYKMLLFLLQHELETTGEVYDSPRLVEMLLGHEGAADHRWYGPVDFTLALDAFQPELAAQNRAWLQQLAQMVQNATERDPTPGFD